MSPDTGVYGWSPGSGGVHYHRVAEPLRVLAAHGIRASTGNRLDDEVCAAHDTILVHMLWDERASEAWRALERADSHRMIFDIDDAMWAPDAWAPFRAHYTIDVMERVYDNIRRAHVVTTPSPYIADQVSKINPNTWLVPNTIPAEALLIDRPIPAGPYRRGQVGYQGSVSHATDWTPLLTGQLAAFLDIRPGWDLHFFGPVDAGGWDRSRVHTTPWQAPGMDYYRDVISLDIGLAPTAKTIFNKGKSGLRAIEYAALGIVGVFPDHEIYRPWVQDGETGIIVRRGGPDVLAELTHLVGDWGMRAQIARNARAKAREWTTEISINKWLEAWNSVGH